MEGTAMASAHGQRALPHRDARIVTGKPAGTDTGAKRLVVVSNRLPVTIASNGRGEQEVRPSSGGLVTALWPVLRRTGGLWFGWSGAYDGNGDVDALLRSVEHECCFKPVPLTEGDVEDYYLGFSNRSLWPLLHGLEDYCEFDRRWWDAYRRVNRRFASLLAEHSAIEDFIWVHDYHLMLVARELRNLGIEQPLCFFLHTPFPAADALGRLPWGPELVRGLLEYDVVGFQTMHDKENFVRCAQAYGHTVSVEFQGQTSVIDTGARRVRASVLPIAIDVSEFATEAASRTVSDRVAGLRESMPGCQMLLGVDRLDYSKGIPLKLQAFADALERFEELRGRVTLVQVVVPSRESIPEYQKVKRQIEEVAGAINDRYGRSDWTPVQCLYRSVNRAELLAYYRAASAVLVTSLKDGMNLVAKEYCAANVEETGVLILSRSTGSAVQLRRDVLLVDPYDSDSVARAIRKAFHMSREERALRMRRLRNRIRKRDIYWWLDLCLRTATADNGDLRAINAMNALSLMGSRSRTNSSNLPDRRHRHQPVLVASSQNSGRRR